MDNQPVYGKKKFEKLDKIFFLCKIHWIVNMPHGAGLFERTVKELMRSKKDYLKSECFRIGLDSMGTKKQLSYRIAEYENGVLEKVRLEAVKDLPPPPQLSETYIARRTKLARLTEAAVKEDIEFSPI